MKRNVSVPKPRLVKPSTKRPAVRTARKTPKSAEVAGLSAAPTEADVARRAYEIFLARQGAPGDPVSDWLQAELELQAGPKLKSAS